MITTLVARIGTLGLALIFVAALVLGGVGGGLVEHYRLAADQQQGDQSGQQGEQANGQSTADEGQSGTQGASTEDQTGSQGTAQEGDSTTDSGQQGSQQ